LQKTKKAFHLKKGLDYILSCIFLLYFGLILLIFHVVQYVVYNLWGQKAHQKIVEALNFSIIMGWHLTGSTYSLTQQQPLKTDKTIIFVANHQSMFDIVGIIWLLRKHTPLFISKKELSKGIPSISYNLRVGKAALIDRKDPKQAIGEILRFSKYVYENNFSAVIFPEGTRSRNGQLKPFAVGGVATLLKKCPEGLLVPIAIENTGLFNPKGLFPLRSFTKMSWNTLMPIAREGKTAEQLVAEAETQIATFLKKNQKQMA
jgi:1-acyl-sn-glycerol-3-phosphate acyltransferase